MVVVATGVVPPEVLVDARPPSHGAGTAVVFGRLGVDDARTDRPRLDDLVAGQEVVKVFQALGQPVDERPNVLEEVLPWFRQVPDDAAESEVVEHESLAREVFEDVLDALALLDRVHKRRGEIAAHVERVGPDGEHMREDAAELGGQRPDHLRVVGDGNIGEILGGPRVGPLVEQAATAPVPAIRVRHDLVAVGPLLAHLLLAAVDVADVWVDGRHLLAVEAEFEMHHPVGGGVVGADVEEHRSLPFLGDLIVEAPVLLAERNDLRLVLVVVQRQRVALPRLREQNPPEVGMVVVRDPDEVVGLPLVPVCGPKHPGGRGRLRLPTGDRNDDARLPCGVVVVPQVVDRLVAIRILLGGDTGEVVQP